MSRDLRIAFTPGNDKPVRLTLEDSEKQGTPEDFHRELPALRADELETLRRGTATDVDLASLTSALSKWLLEPELWNTFRDAVSGADPVRLVLSSTRDIPEVLVDLPFELLTLKDENIPFVLQRSVGALAHQLALGSNRRVVSRTVPLRVLILRASAGDREEVPGAVPLRKRLIRLKRGRVIVDLLSSEIGSGVDGPPTLSGLEDQLGQKPPYDILVFLGHGMLVDRPGSQMPFLIFEDDRGAGSPGRQISTKQLESTLQAHPVPVVLLAGCTTAASAQYQADVPQWMRGVQGVAQSLVSSATAGVQIAIGTRNRLTNDEATCLLEAFFRSLVRGQDGGAKGNVEIAVKYARRMLYQRDPAACAFSTPVLFSSLPSEPVFEFLAHDQGGLQDDIKSAVEIATSTRADAWNILSKSSGQLRDGEAQQTIRNVATLAERTSQQISDAVRKRASSVIPSWVVGQPSTVVEPMPVVLRWQEGKEPRRASLRGKIELDGQGALIRDIVIDESVSAAGYTLLTSRLDRASVVFRLEPGSADARPLADGPLFHLVIAIQDSASGVIPVIIKNLVPEGLSSMSWYQGTGAIIVAAAAA